MLGINIKHENKGTEILCLNCGKQHPSSQNIEDAVKFNPNLLKVKNRLNKIGNCDRCGCNTFEAITYLDIISEMVTKNKIEVL